MNVDGILLLYHHPLRPSAATIMEHVNAFERHSGFAIWKLNTELGFPRRLPELRFSAIVLHYSLWSPSGYYLDERFRKYLDDSLSSCKIAFFQDEHHYCRQRFAFINDYKIDCIYTLLEREHVRDVYGKYTRVSHFVSHIPGYVSDELVAKARAFRLPRGKRTIDVGYRGRELKYYMGKGSQEKTEIAHEFRRRAEGTGLALDVATTEESRLYGDSWYRFLGNCKAFLGTEAGVSIFDTEDVVLREYERLVEENPDMSFEEMEERLLRRWEGNIYYRTISPRHFEAAAFLTGQILYEGRYSGILQPMRHYLPLKKDFSNFDEVVAMFRDDALLGQVAENAWSELIESGDYSYASFLRSFDAELLGKGLTAKLDPAVREKAGRILAQDYAERYAKARLNAVLQTPFPGRKYLVKCVKSVFPGLSRPQP